MYCNIYNTDSACNSDCINVYDKAAYDCLLIRVIFYYTFAAYLIGSTSVMVLFITCFGKATPPEEKKAR